MATKTSSKSADVQFLKVKAHLQWNISWKIKATSEFYILSTIFGQFPHGVLDRVSHSIGMFGLKIRVTEIANTYTVSSRNWLILGPEKTPPIAKSANCETKQTVVNLNFGTRRNSKVHFFWGFPSKKMPFWYLYLLQKMPIVILQ